MVTLAGRRRFALLATVNLAVAAIYLVHLGHDFGLGGYRIDLDVYRTGARVWLRGGDLYGRLPRLADGHELPFTYPPFAALAFVPLAILGYSTANWLLTTVTIASVAASLWCFAASTLGEAGIRMRRLLPWALPAALRRSRRSRKNSTKIPGVSFTAAAMPTPIPRGHRGARVRQSKLTRAMSSALIWP